MEERISLGRALREVLTAPSLWVVALLGTALQSLPRAELAALTSWLIYGYHVGVQRWVRAGETGLPPLRPALARTPRRALAVLVLFIPWTFVLGIVLIAAAAFVPPAVRPVMTIVTAVVLVPVLMAIDVRYSVKESLGDGIRCLHGLRDMLGHRPAFAKALAWLAGTDLVLLAVRWAIRSAFHTQFTMETVFPGASGGSPLLAALFVALALIGVVSGIVGAHLLGQLGVLTYPSGTDGAALEEKSSASSEESDAPAEEIWG